MQEAYAYTENKFLGFGLNATIIKTQVGFSELNLNMTQEAFQKCKNRLIIISSENVLPLIAQSKVPTEAAIQALGAVS